MYELRPNPNIHWYATGIVASRLPLDLIGERLIDECPRCPVFIACECIDAINQHAMIFCRLLTGDAVVFTFLEIGQQVV